MRVARMRGPVGLAAVLAALTLGGAAQPCLGAEGAPPAASAPQPAKAGKAGHPKPQPHRMQPPNEPPSDAAPAGPPPTPGPGAGTASPRTPAKDQAKPAGQAGPEPETPSAPPKPKNLEPIPPGVAVPILGRKVEGRDREDMGRVVDVLVDGTGAPRAAVIDFGGFLGVGSRKIAVDWTLLRFSPRDPDAPITLSLGRDQVQAAPEYQRSEPKASVVGPPKDRPAAAAILVPSRRSPTEPPANIEPPSVSTAPMPAKPAAKPQNAQKPAEKKPASEAAPDAAPAPAPAEGAHPPTETPSPSEAPPQKR